MQIPQALPHRTIEVATNEPDALSAAQPERGREYTQLQRGRFEGTLSERSSGSSGLLYERWNLGVRVRCARPRSYVAFSALRSESPATWCALELQPCSVLELEHDWEVTTTGPCESFSFAIERIRLESVEALLAGGTAASPRNANRVLTTAVSSAPFALLRDRVQEARASAELPPEARRALEDELVHLAARLRRCGEIDDATPESGSRRRRAVRKVEEYLDAHAHDVPSLAELCAIAGVSERTLEYAFREQIGASPTRFLRLRRLNAVRRALLHGEAGPTRVTEVATRWGFWELGRFAREYRALFGELPSQTLLARARLKMRSAHA